MESDMAAVLGSVQLVTELEAALVYRISGVQVQRRIAQGFLVYVGTTLDGRHLYRANV